MFHGGFPGGCGVPPRHERWALQVHRESRITNYFDLDDLNGVVFNMRDMTEEIEAKSQQIARTQELHAVLDALRDQLYRMTRDGGFSEKLSPEIDGFVKGCFLRGRNIVEVYYGETGDRILTAVLEASEYQVPVTIYASETEMVGNAQHVAVLFLDLNDFKPVNDSYGHAAGDARLIQVGERLRAVTGPSGLAARIGGDEFVIMCDGLDQPGEAMEIAERVSSLLAAERGRGRRRWRRTFRGLLHLVA